MTETAAPLLCLVSLGRTVPYTCQLDTKKRIPAMFALPSPPSALTSSLATVRLQNGGRGRGEEVSYSWMMSDKTGRHLPHHWLSLPTATAVAGAHGSSSQPRGAEALPPGPLALTSRFPSTANVSVLVPPHFSLTSGVFGVFGSPVVVFFPQALSWPVAFLTIF